MSEILQRYRRYIYPISDWNKFLEEGKEEFYKLMDLKIPKEYDTKDLEFVRLLGQGAFGRVFLVKNQVNEKLYAVKALDKSAIAKKKQAKHAINERKILQSLNHPFTVFLEFAFQDNSYLFLALPLIAGGEMYKHLKQLRRFDEPLSSFYAAQVLLALEYLHYCDLVYRDLKPENLLIDKNGYVKMTDFGFCKQIKGRTYTLCGTPEYIAPEIILSRGYGKAVDWWSYGILLYEMNAGHAPFRSLDQMKIYEKAVAGRYTIPKTFSPELKDLVENMIQVNLSKRFGNLKGAIMDIKNHPFFRDINWTGLANQNLIPPYKPDVSNVFRNVASKEEIKLRTAGANVYGSMFDDF